MYNLTGISLLGLRRNNKFFGDSLRYASHDEYVLQGNILDLCNTSGAAGILAQLSGMSVGSEDFSPLTVNSTYLGLAQINSVNYSAGVDVKLKNYTINATVYNTGNVFSLNVSDNLYSGVQLNSPLYNVQYIESLSESFDCDIADNGDYSESQKIQVKFISGAAGNTLNPLTMAKQFAANLISSNPAVGFIDASYSGFRRQPGRRSYAETQNLITQEFSVTETFKLLKGLSGSYSISYTNSLNQDENGIINCKEQGKVQGLSPDLYGNYFESAKSGAQYEVNNFSYLRCADLFNSHAQAGAHPLNSRRLSYGQTLNKYTDIVNYEVSYSNDPKTSDLFSWEYTQEIQQEQNECTYKISENGNILGYSADCAPIDKFSNALAGYSTVKAGIYARTYAFYTEFSTFANPIKIIEQSESKNKFNGTISYGRTYTDNLLYSYAGVRKLSINIDDEYAVPVHNNFGIIGYKEIAQDAGISTLGKRSLNLDIQGLRSSVLSNYLSLATSHINSNIPAGTDPYISDLNYSFSPLSNQFSAACTWTYQS